MILFSTAATFNNRQLYLTIIARKATRRYLRVEACGCVCARRSAIFYSTGSTEYRISHYSLRNFILSISDIQFPSPHRIYYASFIFVPICGAFTCSEPRNFPCTLPPPQPRGWLSVPIGLPPNLGRHTLYLAFPKSTCGNLVETRLQKSTHVQLRVVRAIDASLVSTCVW